MNLNLTWMGWIVNEEYKVKHGAYIFDLDGTISNDWQRVHFAKKGDWDNYNKLTNIDYPFKDVVRLMYCIERLGYRIIILTGRPGSKRKETKDWLRSHNINCHRLIMKTKELLDMPTDEWKKQIYLDDLKENYSVYGVFEDRDKLVDMWRELGLTCFQTKNGEY